MTLVNGTNQLDKSKENVLNSYTSQQGITHKRMEHSPSMILIELQRNQNNILKNISLKIAFLIGINKYSSSSFQIASYLKSYDQCCQTTDVDVSAISHDLQTTCVDRIV